MPVSSHVVRSADGVDIAYDVQGQGLPALVFVHGWSGRRAHWDEQAAHFAPTHTVVRIDLAGHGDSGRNRDDWTLPAFADDVAAVLDELSLDRSILIGHSLGGGIIIHAAGRLGSRVVGLIGVDTWSSLGVRIPAETIEESVFLPEMRADYEAGARKFAALECGPTAPADLLERISNEAAALPAHIGIGILDDGIRSGPDETERILQSLTIPRISIACETFRPKDPITLRRFGIQNVVLPGSGHYLMIEKPAEFNRLMDDAVKQITRQAPGAV